MTGQCLLQRLLWVAVLLSGFLAHAAEADACLDRTIPVNVFTEGGDQVTTLKAVDFRASVGKKLVHVTSATYDSGPRRIAVLIDVSGSMSEPPGKLAWSLKFVQDFVSLAPTADSLALLTFASHIEDHMDFGQSRTALLTEVFRLQTPDREDLGEGMTALEDALVSAIGLLKKPRVGDAIYLVSDGGDNASRSRESRVTALLASAGVRVYSLLASPDVFTRQRTPEESPGPSGLRDLAIATGGNSQVFFPGRDTVRDRDQLTRLSQILHSEISSFTKLTVRLPEPLLKPDSWHLELVNAAGRQIKALVIYPHRLAPCVPTP